MVSYEYIIVMVCAVNKLSSYRRRRRRRRRSDNDHLFAVYIIIIQKVTTFDIFVSLVMWVEVLPSVA